MFLLSSQTTASALAVAVILSLPVGPNYPTDRFVWKPPIARAVPLVLLAFVVKLVVVTANVTAANGAAGSRMSVAPKWTTETVA